MSKSTLSVFFSYSHKDETFRDELADHLATLKSKGEISAWHDRMIAAGSDWAKAIDDNLMTADVILLLVSSSFLASDYCSKIELNQAITRHNSGEALIIPIILRPCDWEDSVFGRFQALPKNAKPITKWDDKDEAFTDVVKGIKRAIAEMQKAKTTPVAPVPTPPKVEPIVERVKQQPPVNVNPVELRSAKEIPTSAEMQKAKTTLIAPVLTPPKVEPVVERVKSQPPANVNAVELRSARGIDYRELEKLLKRKEWQKADELTDRLMLKASGREKEGWIDTESIKKFPCEDLQTIDLLWVHYSDGLYGFSIQSHIYRGSFNFVDPHAETWDTFCDRTAWKSEGKWLDYPDQFFLDNFMKVKGHLPFKIIKELKNWGLWSNWEMYSDFFSRIRTCKVQGSKFPPSY